MALTSSWKRKQQSGSVLHVVELYAVITGFAIIAASISYAKRSENLGGRRINEENLAV